MSLVIEEIYNVLTARIAAIEGTTVNDADVVEITEPLADGNVSPKSGQYVIGWGDSIRTEELDVPGNPPGVAYTQTFLIDCNVRDEESTVPFGLLATRYVTGFINGMSSATNWSTMGGYAIDSRFGSWTHKESAGGIGGAVLELFVTYRVSEYDHTVQR